MFISLLRSQYRLMLFIIYLLVTILFLYHSTNDMHIYVRQSPDITLADLLENEISDLNISNLFPLMYIITGLKGRHHVCRPSWFVHIFLHIPNIEHTSTMFALLSSYFIYFPSYHIGKPLQMKWSFISELFSRIIQMAYKIFPVSFLSIHFKFSAH